MLQRLIATHAFVLEHSEKRVTDERPPRDPLAATTLQKKAEASGHSFTRVLRFFNLLPGSLHCRKCQQLVQKRHLKKFLHSQCPGPPAQVPRGRGFLRPRQLRVRRRDLHSSHAVLLYRGLWFCTKCGAYTAGADAIGTVRNLCRPCRPGGRGGQVRLRRIVRGRHPDFQQWPADEASERHRGAAHDLEEDVQMALTLVPCVRLRSKTRLELDQLVLTEPCEIALLLAHGAGGGLDDPEIDEQWANEDDPGAAP